MQVRLELRKHFAARSSVSFYIFSGCLMTPCVLTPNLLPNSSIAVARFTRASYPFTKTIRLKIRLYS